MLKLNFKLTFAVSVLQLEEQAQLSLWHDSGREQIKFSFSLQLATFTTLAALFPLENNEKVTIIC